VHLHFLERIHLLWPVDLDMRNIFAWKCDVEELILVVCRVRHLDLTLSVLLKWFPSSFFD
jgi:hypothetical protein